MVAAIVMLAVLYSLCYRAGLVERFTAAIGSDNPGELRLPDDDLVELFPGAVVPHPAASPSTNAQTTLDTLEGLMVADQASDTGYDREQFGQAWADIDHNGCDTRDDVLGRDLSDVTFKPDTNACVVATGTLNDPYTGGVISFVRGQSTSSAVQIDHIVALAAAWRTGAADWPEEKRTAFANDPTNLLAVDGPANAAKADSDAAEWLPENEAFRCTYVTAQVQVKAAYGLWVTSAEKTAMVDVLEDC